MVSRQRAEVLVEVLDRVCALKDFLEHQPDRRKSDKLTAAYVAAATFEAAIGRHKLPEFAQACAEFASKACCD